MEDENVPDFCTTCSSIGHPATRCKLNQPKEDNGVHVHSGKVVDGNASHTCETKGDDCLPSSEALDNNDHSNNK